MKKCELLVPAGGHKQFIAAVENGADAVYVGGKAYNARINAENFSDNDIERAIDYAHVRGVKTYVTMNTLLTDEELVGACRQAEKYYEMGADAIIVQDIGLGNVLKKQLPDFPLHLSTQGGVYNSKGVLAASKLGYERVVLARELSLNEIKEAVNTGTEIEVFVHGALCFCYSGQCHLSRFIGGRSGNKGMCAQPCRLPYEGVAGKKYPLSPKDLCLIDEVGLLAETGVASLKIEGRMKSPEYVAIVTSIYRKYLDLWEKNGHYDVEPEDIIELKQAFNRGGFTKGYFYGDPEEKLMADNFSKNEGVLVGTIAKDSKGPLADVNTKGNLLKGDYIEIRSNVLSGNLVTYSENIGKDVTRIGDIKSPVKKGDKVYRITSSSLAEKYRKTFENLTFEEGKFRRKAATEMKLEIIIGEKMKLTAKCQGHNVEVVSIITAAKAKGEEGVAEKAKRQLMKTGGTPFEVTNISVEEKEPAYVPLSAINELRRQALDLLLSEIKHSFKRNHVENNFSIGENVCKQNHNIELYFYDKSDFLNKKTAELVKKCNEITGNLEKILAVVPLAQYRECREKASQIGIRLRPYIQGMNKGKAELSIDENWKNILGLLKEDDCGIYVGNISQIEAFAQEKVDVYGDVGLNISNIEAEKAYRTLGMKNNVSSLEVFKSGFGNIPLMITEHQLINTTLTDRKGAKYDTEYDYQSHKTIIKSRGQINFSTVKDEYLQGSSVVRIYV